MAEEKLKLHEWEKVSATQGLQAWRMAVPGGWIYSIETEGGENFIFVPQPASVDSKEERS